MSSRPRCSSSLAEKLRWFARGRGALLVAPARCTLRAGALAMGALVAGALLACCDPGKGCLPSLPTPEPFPRLADAALLDSCALDASVAPRSAQHLAALIVTVDKRRGEASCALKNISDSGYYVEYERPGFRDRFVVYDADGGLVPESELGTWNQKEHLECLGCLLPWYLAAGKTRHLDRITLSEYFVLERARRYQVSCAYHGELVLSGKDFVWATPEGEKVSIRIESERAPFTLK